MRIDKLLADLKYGSRSQIKNLIKQKRILVDGNAVVSPNVNVNPTVSKISFDGKDIYYQKDVYLAINKPVGYLSANKDKLHPVVIDLVGEPFSRFNLKIAGRLDLDTEGLMILTTDGDFIHNLCHPTKSVAKTYEVCLDKPLEANDINALKSGIIVKDAKNSEYQAIALEIDILAHAIKIVVDEGKFHQVKRMFSKLGYRVLNLKRVQIGKLILKDQKPGSYWPIKKEDVL